MNSNAKIYQKLKKYKYPVNKSKIILGDKNSRIDNYNQFSEIQEDDNVSFIKSKSLKKSNKIKTNIRLNKSCIKLPTLKKNIYKNNNLEKNNSKLIKQFNKDNSTKKIKVNINNLDNLSLYPKNQSSKKLISKYRSSYNIKTKNNINLKDIPLNTYENIGKTRHLNRKIIKRNKKNKQIIIPKDGYKLFTTTKIINNFNNQINQNKNKEIYALYKNCENNVGKKLDVLYEIEQKVSKIQNCFRRHLKEEETEEKKNKNIENNNIDIISDISLSEEDLNFSEEDSFNNIEFSLDEEEI